MHNIVPEASDFVKARGSITSFMYCILTFQPINLLLIIFNIMTADNITYCSLPFDMVLTRLFSHWYIDIQEKIFQSSPEPLGASFLHRKMSHLSKCSGGSLPLKLSNPLMCLPSSNSICFGSLFSPLKEIGSHGSCSI